MEAIIQLRYIGLLSAFCALGACAPSRNFDAETATAARVATELPTPTAADIGQRQRDIRLGAFDKLIVTIFGVPDLTTKGAVDSSGNFSMPLIGAVPAGGFTSGELAQDISKRMARYVRNPQVNVEVEEAVSRQITIEGSVTKPGIYKIEGETSLLRAMAIAGGLANDATRRDILIFRTVEGQKMVARFNLNDIRGARAVDPQVYGNDIIVVSNNANRSMFLDIIQAAPLLNLFYLLR